MLVVRREIWSPSLVEPFGQHNVDKHLVGDGDQRLPGLHLK